MEATGCNLLQIRSTIRKGCKIGTIDTTSRDGLLRQHNNVGGMHEHWSQLRMYGKSMDRSVGFTRRLEVVPPVTNRTNVKGQFTCLVPNWGRKSPAQQLFHQMGRNPVLSQLRWVELINARQVDNILEAFSLTVAHLTKSGNLREALCHPIPTHRVVHTDINISSMLIICVTPLAMISMFILSCLQTKPHANVFHFQGRFPQAILELTGK